MPPEIARLEGHHPQRISVKSRTFSRGASFVAYDVRDDFDWPAVVLLQHDGPHARRIFVVPKDYADRHARRNKPTARNADERYQRIDELSGVLGAFENNLTLKPGAQLTD
jgi:hypothetical protein